jgi:predicted dehydrogenase
MGMSVSIVLAGARGHGRSHLRNIGRLAADGLVRLTGVCELTPLDESELAGLGFPERPAPEQSDDFAALLDSTGAEVAVLCTPIHTHVDMALTAAARGVHILLEKPPAPSFAEFQRMVDGVRAAGTACQIGFQSLGSDAVPGIRALVADGAIGTVRGIGAAGAWVREDAYWRRSPWAGLRTLNGRDVVDGALTNPLAHAPATALRIAGADRAEDIAGVDLELYRANGIEADDTSCARIRTVAGPDVVTVVTLCAEEHGDPYVVVHGDAGRMTLWYKDDRVLLERTGREPETIQYQRTDLLSDLLGHLRDGRPLLVPAERTGAFMRLVEAVRTAPEPSQLPPGVWRTEPGTASDRRVISGIDPL